MLKRMHTARPSRPLVGVGIEDQAALVIDGDNFSVVSADDRSGVIRKEVFERGEGGEEEGGGGGRVIRERRFSPGADVWHPLSDLCP